MSNYGANMPPSATAGAYSGNGMPSFGMQANAGHFPNASIKSAPAYTSPASYGSYPMGCPMPYGPMKPAPVYAAAAASSAGVILVLFILLVIILRTF